MPNEVCSGCEPFNCESCGMMSSLAFRRAPIQLPQASKIAIRIMGFGAYVKPCVDCGEHKTLGDARVCMDCAVKRVERGLLICHACLTRICISCGEDSEILNSQGICPICERTEEWTPKSWGDRGEVGACGKCGGIFTLNNEGLCKSCYVVEGQLPLCENCGTPSKNRYCDKCSRKSLKICAECMDKFVANNDSEVICQKCRPYCIRCSKKFQPIRRGDNYCEPCEKLMLAGICAKCGLDTGSLDQYGECLDCSNDDHGPKGVYYCGSCKVRKVGKPNQTCTSCMQQWKRCPICKVEEIRFNDFMCTNCLNNGRQEVRPSVPSNEKVA